MPTFFSSALFIQSIFCRKKHNSLLHEWNVATCLAGRSECNHAWVLRDSHSAPPQNWHKLNFDSSIRIRELWNRLDKYRIYGSSPLRQDTDPDPFEVEARAILGGIQLYAHSHLHKSPSIIIRRHFDNN